MGERVKAAVAELRRMAPPPVEPTWGEWIFGFLFALVLMAAFFWFLERYWPEDAEQPPVSPWRPRPAAGLDLTYWFLAHYFNQKLTVVFVVAMAIGFILLRIPRAEWLLAHQPLWLQALEALFLGDLTGYWVHRAFHHWPRWWRFHAVHHSSTRLDWLAAARVHPVETVLNRLVPFAVIYLLGFSLQIGAFYGPFLALYAILLHANVGWHYGPLRWVVAAPAYHRWHHSADAAARDKNFAGLFPVIDLIFGTAYYPRTGRPQRYGVAGDPPPETLRGQLLFPFRKPASTPPAESAPEPLS